MYNFFKISGTKHISLQHILLDSVLQNKMTSEGTLDDLDLVKWAPEMPTVQEISESMQNFGIPDYTVFAVMLIICGIVGIYFGFVKKSSGEDEYLVGGRNMQTFPISLSLLASFISGITIFSFSISYFFCISCIIFFLLQIAYINRIKRAHVYVESTVTYTHIHIQNYITQFS